VVAPPAEIAAAPTVHVENIALTGIGQDIYYAITPWVQGAVAWSQYAVSFVPFIGPPIAGQIGINYFGGIQPVVQARAQVRQEIKSARCEVRSAAKAARSEVKAAD
jgi:hypothetical protein